MTTEAVWRDVETRRVVTRSTTPSKATLELLSSTVWGSKAMRYRILNVGEKLSRLRAPSFFVLSENGRELCVFVLDKCRKRLSGKTCTAFHFVMASTVPDRQNQGLAGILIEHVRRYCVSNVGEPGFGFAYVEETTEFSLRLSDQIGHSAEAAIPLTLFTRLFPKNHGAVDVMKPSESGIVLEELENMYAGHELTDFPTTLKPEEFVVFREKGTIIAGVQVEALHWSVMSMPGALGRFMISVLPHLPGLNRVLDLKKLTILRMSNLFFVKGHETEVYALLEACLHKHRSKVGLILLDARSPILNRILSMGRMGLLAHAVNGSATLRIDTVGMSDEMMSDLTEHPLLVSSGDVF